MFNYRTFHTETDATIFIRRINEAGSALATVSSLFVDTISKFGTIVVTLVTALVEICLNNFCIFFSF